MRVAILSLVLHTNYGGLLQSYALQTILQKQGHTVEILSRINRMPDLKWYKKPFCYTKRLFLKLFKDRRTPIFFEKKYNDDYAILGQFTNQFIKRNLNVRIIKSFDDIKANDYDAYIVGSDQVWRKKYFCSPWVSPIENAYLGFTKCWNVRRIAYAASFGVDEWELTEEETYKCADLVKAFEKVGVRELSAVDLCKKNLNVVPTQVLDPTMLLPIDEYEKLVKDEMLSEGDLLSYILDETDEKKKLVHTIAKNNGLSTFFLNYNYNIIGSSKKEVTPKPSVQKWVKGFMDAKFVITDSFHACVFSIIFKKPFLAIVNKGRGATRFETLAKLFGVEKNILYSVSEYDPKEDYLLPNNLDEKKSRLVSESLRFLSFD